MTFPIILLQVRKPTHVFPTSHPLILFPCQQPSQTHHTPQICGGYGGFLFKEHYFEDVALSLVWTIHIFCTTPYMEVTFQRILLVYFLNCTQNK